MNNNGHPQLSSAFFIFPFYQGIVSLGRISKFLDLDENDYDVSDEGLLDNLPDENQPRTDAIIVEDGSFSWGAKSPVLSKLVALEYIFDVVVGLKDSLRL